MRNARRVVGILGALAGGALSCGGMLVGCGGDDSGGVSTADGGDATADGARDAPPALDGRADVAAEAAPGDARLDSGNIPDARVDTGVTSDASPDTGARPDSGMDATIDAPRPTDATVDVAVDSGCVGCGLPDARAEAQTDATVDATTMDAPVVAPDVGADVAPDVGSIAAEAGIDAAPDVVDAGSNVADVGPDSSEELAFPGRVATALCTQIESCCFPDGGSSQFDMNGCVAQISGSGYQYSSFGESAIPNGNIVYNTAVASACVTAINSIGGSCNVTAAIQPQIMTNCFDALTGTLPAGAACVATLECSPNHYCASNDGGPSGVCTPIQGAGQPCNQLGVNAPAHLTNSLCSYRASGNNGRTCQTFMPDGTPIDPSAWVCAPQSAVGAACILDSDCVAPMICDTSINFGTCVATSRKLLDVTQCSGFLLDAGGGG